MHVISEWSRPLIVGGVVPKLEVSGNIIGLGLIPIRGLFLELSAP